MRHDVHSLFFCPWDAHQCERDEAEWQIRRREQRRLEWQSAQQLFKKADEMPKRPLDDSRWATRDASTFLETASKSLVFSELGFHEMV